MIDSLRIHAVNIMWRKKILVEKSVKPAKNARKKVLVDSEQFTNVVRKLVNSGPIKREDVKGESPKPGKVIQPRS